MIIIDRKDNDSVDRMIKAYRRKHRDTKLIKELRKRKEFTKPSVTRRKEILKAIYKGQKGV